MLGGLNNGTTDYIACIIHIYIYICMYIYIYTIPTGELTPPLLHPGKQELDFILDLGESKPRWSQVTCGMRLPGSSLEQRKKPLYCLGFTLPTYVLGL